MLAFDGRAAVSDMLWSTLRFSEVLLFVLLRFTDSDYPFGIIKLFLWILTHFAFLPFLFGHCIVCTYGYWLPLWYIETLRHNNKSCM